VGFTLIKRLSHEDFHKLLEAVWEAGPEVKYKNPDAWITHMIKRALKEKKEKE